MGVGAHRLPDLVATLATSPMLSLLPRPTPTLIPSPTHTLSYLLPDRGSLQLSHPWPRPSYCSWVEWGLKVRAMLLKERVGAVSTLMGPQTGTPQPDTCYSLRNSKGQVRVVHWDTALRCSTDNDTQH